LTIDHPTELGGQEPTAVASEFADASDRRLLMAELKERLEDSLGISLNEASRHVLRTAREICGGRMSDARDLAQDVFLRLISNVQTGKTYTVRDPLAYLRQTTRNMFADNTRRRQNRFDSQQLSLDLWGDVGAPERPLDARVSDEFELRQVRLAMKELTEEQRELAKLAWIDGRSVSECAAKLGIPDSTVRSRLKAITRAIRSSVRRISGGS
jgi:RNA polymerase sigma factor (sigma-70 family)